MRLVYIQGDAGADSGELGSRNGTGAKWVKLTLSIKYFNLKFLLCSALLSCYVVSIFTREPF